MVTETIPRQPVRSIKEERLNRMILSGEAQLRHEIGECLAHHYAEETSPSRGQERVLAAQQSHRLPG